MMISLILLINTQPSWSNEWSEGWRKLLPGYVVTEPLMAAPWDWGRTVFTGAMAEHEELKTMTYRITTIEQELREAMDEANKTNVELEYQVSIMEENLQTLQDNMNKELSRSYNRGLAKGGALGFIIGISMGLIID